MAKIKAGAKAAAERARQRLAAARESGEEPVDLGAGFKADGAPRNPEAIKRWHWAFRQIKLKRKLAKLGADVRCAPYGAANTGSPRSNFSTPPAPPAYFLYQ